jgi:hypothetical protein
VTAAEQLITAAGPRPVVLLDVLTWARAYGLNRDQPSTIPLIGPGDGFDRAYAMTTDLTRPLLLATLPTADGASGHLLIDGCHRLYHAWSTGQATLTAYELNRAETDSVLLRRPDPDTGRSTRSARHRRTPRPRTGRRT